MSEVLLYNYAVRARGPEHPEQRMIDQIKIQRKIELTQKYNRVEKALREALVECEFSQSKEQFFMNRTTGRPSFMEDKAIELAA